MILLAVLMLAVLFAAVTFCALWAAEDIKKLAGRGEVAEPPEQLPRTKACPLNATPHFCCDPAEPLPSVPVGTGESLARELTDYLKGNR